MKKLVSVFILVFIIGSGFAGLSAACFMAKAGCKVIVLEKHTIPGGRARQLKADGFTLVQTLSRPVFSQRDVIYNIAEGIE